MRNEILSLFPNGVFAHHGGHGIGIDVAEHPQLLPDETATIQEGMVLAIEPGVYFPGRFGVRVEDVYAVGNTQGSRLGAGATAADGGGRSTNRSA
jgi:Xaa-Pro aminopeptidase